MKKIIAFLLAAVLLCPSALAEYDMEADEGEVDAAVFEESGVETAAGPEVSAPSAIIALTDCVQRTGDVSCARRLAFIFSGSVSGIAVTFW